MTDKNTSPETLSKTSFAGMPLLITGVVVVCLGIIFSDGFAWMFEKWQREEYNHGYLIPVVAFYLLWLRADQLEKMSLSGA